MHLSHKLAFIDFLFHSLTITWNNTPPPTQKMFLKTQTGIWYLKPQLLMYDFLKKKKKKSCPHSQKKPYITFLLSQNTTKISIQHAFTSVSI